VSLGVASRVGSREYAGSGSLRTIWKNHVEGKTTDRGLDLSNVEILTVKIRLRSEKFRTSDHTHGFQKWRITFKIQALVKRRRVRMSGEILRRVLYRSC